MCYRAKCVIDTKIHWLYFDSAEYDNIFTAVILLISLLNKLSANNVLLISKFGKSARSKQNLFHFKRKTCQSLLYPFYIVFQFFNISFHDLQIYSLDVSNHESSIILNRVKIFLIFFQSRCTISNDCKLFEGIMITCYIISV